MTEVSTNIPLGGESCPKCKSVEAWHGCITEDDSTKYACDECGMWMTVQVTRPAPPKRKRPFGFMLEVDEKGQLFIDWRGDSVLAFKRGRYLQIGSIEIVSNAETDRRDEASVKVGREAGRRQAEEAFAAGGQS